ncbi:MAG TPA: hypothetical protein VGU23_04935, partial [Acidobacteriaceae bacterium]|nr:hypothetical protein [Acidobacteriaceae bacterium]
MPRAIKSPRPPGYDHGLACEQLAAADAKLGRLIERAGPFTLRIASTQSPFEALVQSIIYQQLHGKAAAAIHRRMIESFAGTTAEGALYSVPPAAKTAEAGAVLAAAHLNPVHPSPEQLLDCPNEQLRAAGLSHNKILAL